MTTTLTGMGDFDDFDYDFEIADEPVRDDDFDVSAKAHKNKLAKLKYAARAQSAGRSRQLTGPKVVGPAPRPQTAGTVVRAFPRTAAAVPPGPNRKAQDAERIATLPLKEWTVRDVCNWVESIGYPQLKHKFLHNCIDGPLLAKLTNRHLQVDIGVTSLGHRHAILQGVQDLLSERRASPQRRPQRPQSAPRPRQNLRSIGDDGGDGGSEAGGEGSPLPQPDFPVGAVRLTAEQLKAKVAYDAERAQARAMKLKREAMAAARNAKQAHEDYKRVLGTLAKIDKGPSKQDVARLARSLNDMGETGADKDGEKFVVPWYPSGEGACCKNLTAGGLGGVIEAQKAPFKPKLNKYRGGDTSKEEDKRDFITKMEEKLQKRRRDLEEARKQQLRDQLGVGDPATIRERMAKENAFLRECLVERLRTQDVRTDPEAIAEYIRHDGDRIGLWGPGVLNGPTNKRIIAALENDKKRQGLVASTQATFEPRELQRAQQALRFFDHQVMNKKKKFLIEFFRGAKFMERLERDMEQRRAAKKVLEVKPKPGRSAEQRAEKLLLKEARLFFTGRLGWGGEADPEWAAVMEVADAPEHLAQLIERADYCVEHLCAIRERLQADADVLKPPRPGTGRNNSLSPRRYPIGSAGFTTERNVAKEFVREQFEREKHSRMLEPPPPKPAEAAKPAEDDPYGDLLAQQQAAKAAEQEDAKAMKGEELAPWVPCGPEGSTGKSGRKPPEPRRAISAEAALRPYYYVPRDTRRPLRLQDRAIVSHKDALEAKKVLLTIKQELKLLAAAPECEGLELREAAHQLGQAARYVDDREFPDPEELALALRDVREAVHVALSRVEPARARLESALEAAKAHAVHAWEDLDALYVHRLNLLLERAMEANREAQHAAQVAAEREQAALARSGGGRPATAKSAAAAAAAPRPLTVGSELEVFAGAVKIGRPSQLVKMERDSSIWEVDVADIKEHDGKQWIALDAETVLVRPAPRTEAESDAPWALVDPALEPEMTPVVVAAMQGIGRDYVEMQQLVLDDAVALLQCSPAEVMDRLRAMRDPRAKTAAVYREIRSQCFIRNMQTDLRSRELKIEAASRMGWRPASHQVLLERVPVRGPDDRRLEVWAPAEESFARFLARQYQALPETNSLRRSGFVLGKSLEDFDPTEGMTKSRSQRRAEEEQVETSKDIHKAALQRAREMHA